MLRLMRDILASLPGAAGSKELHQCIQLFTATALDQVLISFISFDHDADNGLLSIWRMQKRR